MTKVVTLAHYDAACRELELAKSVDEAKDLRNKAEAMRAYARQAKNKKAELYAAEIRIRAERKLGELLKDTEKAPGSKHRKKPVNVAVVSHDRQEPAKLEELGISKDLSSRSQKLADVPKEVFEQKLGELRRTVEEEGKRVTTDLMKIGEDAKKQTDAKPREWQIKLSLPPEEYQRWSDAAKSEKAVLTGWIRKMVNDGLKMKVKPFLTVDVKPQASSTNGIRDLPPKDSAWSLRGWRHMVNTYNREPTEAEWQLYQHNRL